MRLQRELMMFTLACAVLATAGMVSAATMATSFDLNSGTQQTNTNTVGWRFGLTDDIMVTDLGCLNGVTSGAPAGATHQVGIYSESTQALLAQATVYNGAAGSTSQQWSWTTLASPIRLSASDTYRIATYMNGGPWTYNTDNHSVASEILIGSNLSSTSPGNIVAAYKQGTNQLQYPSDLLWEESIIWDGIYGGNFQYELAAPSTTLFYDNFDGVGATHASQIIAAPAPVVGTWSLSGGGTSNFRWSKTSGLAGLPATAEGDLFGMSLRPGTGSLTNIDANFALQSDVTDTVTFEAEVWGQNAGSTPVDLKLSILSGGTELNDVTFSGGSTSGTVLVGGVATSLTYALNQWHHVKMDYHPTDSTFDLTVDGQTLTGLTITTPSAVDGFRFVETSTGNDRWACFDVVEVTLTSPIPEPSTLALLACGLVGLLVCGRRRR
ncbi:MAG: DUF4082 domain-containing protein [Pirellulales bacterium]|nr:DUF4082 domain-containing protein [Pirellulales bacterium]